MFVEIMWLIVAVIYVGLLIQINKLSKKVEKLDSLTIDTYKGHHEHILLANRDKNCKEEVSSKTDPKFIRCTKKNGKPGAFIPQDRKTHGPCTRTEAKG